LRINQQADPHVLRIRADSSLGPRLLLLAVPPGVRLLIMDGIFLQQLINGLTLGAVYGLIAIGYTMVYGIIGMINFAHGEVYMISAYLAAISLALLAYFGIESFPLLILGT
jgi:ABC-type branched-subunit amino acid transport system permease subunit